MTIFKRNVAENVGEKRNGDFNPSGKSLENYNDVPEMPVSSHNTYFYSLSVNVNA